MPGLRRSPQLAACLAATAFALSGCATYRPAPLGDGAAALDPPSAAVLRTQSAAIDRPWLTPTTIDLDRPLDANAVAVLAVLRNPDLKAQRAQMGVSDAQAFAARLLPDPSFSFSYDRLLSGPDDLDQFGSALAQDLALLRDRKVIAQQNRAHATQVRLDLAWAEWQTAGAARLQVVRILALEEQVALGQASSADAQSLLTASLRASMRGDVTADPVQANRLAALDAADKLRTNQLALATARGELRRLLGLPPGMKLMLTDSPAANELLDPARLFALAQHRRPDLQALRAGYEAQEASVHKAVLDQFPTLSLGMQGSRDSTGNQFLGGAVNFTLPLWNRNRGGIAVEKATRTALKYEYEARLAQTRSDITAAVEGIALARHSIEDLSLQIPALERYAKGAANATARGDLSQATATTAQQTLRDRQGQLSVARQALAEQMIALELLTGAPITTWDRDQ
ncbi:MAG: TolC family protein [Sphingomonadales bacterium]|nr:TolC family protein [Sphingomonadales bacterium]MDE2172097.1 TolC family protein [Sphingomonadales bacterium]